MENVFQGTGFSYQTHETKWLDSSKPDFPCTAEELPNYPDVKAMCYFNQSIAWSASLQQYDYRSAIAGCMRAPKEARAACFEGVGFTMGFGLTGLTDDQLIQRCDLPPTESYRKSCLLGATAFRSILWKQYYDFRNPVYCVALGFNDLDSCNQYVFDNFSWFSE